MIIIIDTSSLLALVRYYLPFDKNKLLYTLLEEKFTSGELVILDKLYDEFKYISGGIILTELPFLKNAKLHVKTGNLIPTRAFFSMLENQFCNQEIRKLKSLTETEFENEKNRYLNSPDATLLIYALSIKKENPIVITEETKNSNDGKLFKKIPENCRCTDINCDTLPSLIKNHLGIDLGEYLN